MDDSPWKRNDGSLWREVRIPSNNGFLKQYHQWVYSKVAKRFRRDKDRVQDTVQNVRVRLLQKDFIGRWFFKHLTHELVDRAQAEHILGRDTKLKFISIVQPVVGKRSESDSLWRISDLLDYAKFDHDRFYYSIQNHTIDSESMLRLLGYPPGSYNALKSLYKQGRIKPAELTHEGCCEVMISASPIAGKCSVPDCGKKHFSRGFCTTHYGHHIKSKCSVCEKGRASLHARGVSLADDWMLVPNAAAAIRWNDSQLRPFLRQWRGQNLVCSVPQRIYRPDGEITQYQGIEAGLLKYAWIMINNEVINDFKRMSRTLDAASMVFNDGISPDIGDVDVIGWESDENGDKPQMVVKDTSAMDSFQASENEVDVIAMISKADLTDEEHNVIIEIDLKETNIREYAVSVGVSVAHIHRVRNSALEKMRHVDMPDSFIVGMMAAACQKYGCSMEDMLGPDRVGPCVRARAEFFHNLSKFGLSIDEMAVKTGMSHDRINSSIGRAVLRERFLLGMASE